MKTKIILTLAVFGSGFVFGRKTIKKNGFEELKNRNSKNLENGYDPEHHFI